MAKTMCEEFVKDELKAPATAKSAREELKSANGGAGVAHPHRGDCDGGAGGVIGRAEV
jgi:hypothetical protein